MLARIVDFVRKPCLLQRYGSASLSRLRVSTISFASVLLCATAGTGNSQSLGSWVSGGDMQVVGAHMALMPNGKVLTFGYKDKHHANDETGRYQMWDPVSRTALGESIVIEKWNPFCGGHSFAGNGSLFVAGGFKSGDPFRASSADHVATFSSPRSGPVTLNQNFDRMEDMRWYPTVVTLASGNALVMGGSAPFAADNWKDTNADYEYFDTRLNVLVDKSQTQKDFPDDKDFAYQSGDRRQVVADGKKLAGLYPLVHLLPRAPGDDAPEGLLFVLNESFVRVYNPATNKIVRGAMDAEGFRTWWTQGSSVLLPISIDQFGNSPPTVRIMVVGGGLLGKADATADAFSTADIYEYNIATRDIRMTKRLNLKQRRFMGDSILLPDGNIIIVGGAQFGYANENGERVRQAELVDLTPNAERTINLAEASTLRGYHASALLLPDGSIAVGGGNGGWNNGPVNEFKSMEVFLPPYLSIGERPQILSNIATISLDQELIVDVSGQAIQDQVVLVRHGSRTHSLDTDQRVIRLEAKSERLDDKTVRLTARTPKEPSIMPPGPYMMFVLSRPNQTGSAHQSLTPSDARLVAVTNTVASNSIMTRELRISVVTGQDNLDSGNDAFVSLLDESGRSLGEWRLDENDSDEFSNNSISTRAITLDSPIFLRDLERVVLRHTADGPLTGDNWNIDRVILDYKAVGSSQWSTLQDKSGSPLLRLTGQAMAQDIRLRN